MYFIVFYGCFVVVFLQFVVSLAYLCMNVVGTIGIIACIINENENCQMNFTFLYKVKSIQCDADECIVPKWS